MSEIPRKADVVVIGGGPAGSTAANLLAQNKYDVVLLDQARHPRNTIGESVLPHVWKYIDEVGATEDIRNAGFIRKSGDTAIWRGVIRQSAMADFGFAQPSLHVERDEFDAILLRVAERKGVRVCEEVGARQLRLDGDEKVVSYVNSRSGEEGRISCRYIVDASGQGAVIANHLGGREFDSDLRFTSVWGYYANSAYVGLNGLICPWEKRREINPTTTQAGIDDGGWIWHIVQKEYSSVGLVLGPTQAVEFNVEGEILEERFDAACRKLPILGDLLSRAELRPGSVRTIRDFAYRPGQLAGDGWCLAGDAAALVDAINSAGVVTASHTGFAAAWTADACLKKPAKSEYFTAVFSALVRQRLALFRISALPPGRNSYPEDNAIALRAAQLDSRTDQELLLVQTKLTDRSENLAPLFQMDPKLNYQASDKYREVPELVPLESAG